MAETVASHLMGGYLLFALNVFILYRLKRKRNPILLGQILPTWIKVLIPILMGIIFFQAAVGGSVSSNYAGLACPDFPTCHGQWLPALSGMIGLQFAHRLLAFVLLFGVLALAIIVMRKLKDQYLAGLLWGGFILIALQITWGVSMIFTELHPAFQLLHSATSLGIFTCLLLGTIHVSRR